MHRRLLRFLSIVLQWSDWEVPHAPAWLRALTVAEFLAKRGTPPAGRVLSKLGFWSKKLDQNPFS
ncbi:hypothetical protein [Streptomyces spiralis]|uniref:hypothetical protein n=1 Tax=Streptomyces spiralis TaxID=66376 RepID=UPI0036C547FB